MMLSAIESEKFNYYGVYRFESVVFEEVKKVCDESVIMKNNSQLSMQNSILQETIKLIPDKLPDKLDGGKTRGVGDTHGFKGLSRAPHYPVPIKNESDHLFSLYVGKDYMQNQ